MTKQQLSDIARKAAIKRWHPDMVVEIPPTDPRSREELVARRDELTRLIRHLRQDPRTADAVRLFLGERQEICAELHRRYSRARRARYIADGLHPKTGRPLDTQK